jgi:hypothetical protein
MKSIETPPTGNRENTLFAGSSPAISTTAPLGDFSTSSDQGFKQETRAFFAVEAAPSGFYEMQKVANPP